MNIKSFTTHLTFGNYLQVLVLSIPILLITGPFLPDLFLSLSVFSFLIYLVMKKKLNFLRHKIFYLFLVFYLILVISSLLSEYSSKSLITSIGYIRFGIFLFVVNFLINVKEDFIKKIHFVLISVFIVLFLDAILQKLTGSNILGTAAPYGRITSLFGDDIKLGGYIVRITPLLIAISIYQKFSRKFIFFIFFISLFLTLISGERTSFFMLLMFLGGYLIFDNISLKLKFLYFLITLVLIFALFLNKEIRHRVMTSTLNQINITNEKPFYKTVKQEDGSYVVLHRDSTILPRIYHMYFETAFKIFKDNLLFGSGPRTYPFKSNEEKYYTTSDHEGWVIFVKKHNKKMMRELVESHENVINKISKFKKYKDLRENIDLINDKEYKDWLKGYGLSHIDFNERIKDKKWLSASILNEKQKSFTNISGVNNHPHNTYLQLLSETGFFGFIFILALWFFCILKLFSKIDVYNRCLLFGLIINLFPFIFSGNFFNGWLSILYFYPLGFLLKEKVKS
tara:strand:+ start:2487 stop:4016 length:1530 start_codon:yes stop_codon:yes gene_type:complete